MNNTGKITLLMPYYRAPKMLERHYEEWNNYSPGTKAKLRIILVDDGSPEPMKIEDVGIDMLAYRVLKDIRWNKDGARNLAMLQTPDEWALMTDMDHLLTAENAKKMVEHVWEAGAFYQPYRIWPWGEPTEGRHQNSFILRREDFWKIGGYDEDWTGWYGSDTTFRKNLRAVAKMKPTDVFSLIHYEGTIVDASTSDFGRKGSEHYFRQNKKLCKKRKSRAYKAKNPIRFEWEQIKLGFGKEEELNTKQEGIFMKSLQECWEFSCKEIAISDKGTVHAYLNFYDHLFQKKKKQKRKTHLLEIGVKEGGSLAMWHYYFGKDSIIHGVDFKEARKLKNYSENIKVFVGDAYTKEMVSRLTEKYDIIIDDGSHLAKDMVFVIENYLPLLKNDGILVIEDIKFNKYLHEHFKAVYRSISNEMKPYFYIVDRRLVKNRHDDMMLIINKELAI